MPAARCRATLPGCQPFPAVAHRIETALRDAVAAVLRRRGWTPTVLAYPGYGADGRARVLGRVLLAPRAAHPEARVAVPGWQRLLTLEAPRTEVQVEVDGATRTLCSDDDGLLDAVLELPDDGMDRPRATAVFRAGSRASSAPVHLVSPRVHRAVVCDVDDTVLVTGIGSPLVAAWRTFVQDPRRRRAVPGMAALLGELTAGAEPVPVVYLSNGPWNLADPLRRFLERAGFPPGALLLTDWGVQPDRWFRSGREHKRTSLLRLAEDLPGVRWTLVGDTGEHDPALYEEFARGHPDRVEAVLLRDLTLGRGELVREAVGDVPVLRGRDGRELAAAWPLSPLPGATPRAS